MPPAEEAADISELCNRLDAAVQRMTDASAAHAAVAVGREAYLEKPTEKEEPDAGGLMPPPAPPMQGSFSTANRDGREAYLEKPTHFPKATESNELPWAPLLRTAWIEYCAATPTNLREIPAFLRPVAPAATLYRNLHGSSSTGFAGRRGGGGKPGSSGGMAPAPQHTDPGPPPEAVRILMPKYGLIAGSVHRVLGATKLTWKLVGAKAVPFHHEGLGWERAPAEALQEAGGVEQQPLDLANVHATGAVQVEEDQLPRLAQTPQPPWTVRPHPEQPGEYYYFNEETGEAAWSLPGSSDTNKRQRFA